LKAKRTPQSFSSPHAEELASLAIYRTSEIASVLSKHRGLKECERFLDSFCRKDQAMMDA
jgi:hypothetical protein